jgi:transposase
MHIGESMMNNLSAKEVYLACGNTDLRKSIDGLAVLVKERFQLDPFSPALFVFCNRKRDKLKILHWDHNGFWLYYRRLERDLFQWPEKDGAPMKVGYREFRWLLDGLSVQQCQAHQPVTERKLI